MKSLIIKDLYNIGHNAKSMFLMLLFMAVVLFPFSGISGYITVCAVLCNMMMITTFSFDTNADWNRYAMIMPVSRKNLVAGKFIVSFLFSAIGTVFGLIVGTVIGLILKKIVLTPESILELLFYALTALIIAFVVGGVSIPLIFKFGTEKARMLTLVSFILPAGICFLIYQLLTVFGIKMTDQLFFILLCCSPVIALVWNYLMYRISFAIFSKQEL